MQTKAQQYHDAIGEDDIARNDDVRLKQSPVPEDLFAYTCISAYVVNTHMHTRAQELPHACTYAGYNKKYRPGPQDTQRSDACIPIQHRPRVNNSRRVYTSGGVPGTRARLGGGLACLGCAAGGTPRRVRCQQCLAAGKRGCKRAIRVAAIAWHAVLAADLRGGTWAAGWQTPRLRGPAPFLAEVDCLFLLFPQVNLG